MNSKLTCDGNGRGALAENPDVARAVGERDREGRPRAAALSAGNTFLEPVLNLQISSFNIHFVNFCRTF